MRDFVCGENVGLPCVTVIPRNVIKNSKSKLYETIDKKLTLVKEKILVDNELMDKVTNGVVEKKVVEEISLDYDLSKIDFNYELKEFLSCQRSVHTSNSYSQSINLFLRWSKENDVKDILKVNSKTVDSFLCYLNSKYSSRTVQNYLMGNCSFFKFLQYRYPKSFIVNPFHGRKLPKITDTRRKDFVCENDIKIVRKEFVRIDRKDMVCVIDILSKYGLRVGVFSEMEIGENGKWSSISKGKNLSGKFTKKEVKQINESGVLNLSSGLISRTIVKYTKKLYEKKSISCPFSVHDLRRFYIHKEGEKYNLDGFIKFSKTIHRNVSTTLGYIS
jgi:site-specific recombinase XerC